MVANPGDFLPFTGISSSLIHILLILNAASRQFSQGTIWGIPDVSCMADCLDVKVGGTTIGTEIAVLKEAPHVGIYE